MNYTILFDTETTGLLAPEVNRLDAQPYIVEMYAVKVDEGFNIIQEFESYFKPPVPIPRDVSRIHGIDDAKVKNSPKFADKVDELTELFLGVRTMVGHNLAFDRSMLANELHRLDRVLKFPWPPKHVCTVEMSMPIEQRRLNLENLHTYATGKPHANAHTAKADVFALVRCYHWLLENQK